MKSLYLAGVLALAAGSVNAATIHYHISYFVDEVTYEYRAHGRDKDDVLHNFTFSKTVALETPITIGASFSVNTERYGSYPKDKIEWAGWYKDGIYGIPRGGSYGSIKLGEDGIPTEWSIDEGYLYYGRTMTTTSAYETYGWYSGYEILDQYNFGVSISDDIDGWGWFEQQWNSTKPLSWTVVEVISPDDNTPAPVPLPAAGGLLLASLAGLCVMTRRNKAA